MPVIRRNENEAIGRPKREIHPPPSKDLPYVDAPKKIRKGKRVKDDGTAEQLKYCGKILSDLNRKQHYNVASPFYEPVGRYPVPRLLTGYNKFAIVRLGKNGFTDVS
jgi:hypothetical protein